MDLASESFPYVSRRLRTHLLTYLAIATVLDIR